MSKSWEVLGSWGRGIMTEEEQAMVQAKAMWRKRGQKQEEKEEGGGEEQN
jgi:hypothetical protein